LITHSKPTIGSEEKDIIRDILNSSQLGPGKYTAEFEKMVAEDSGLQDAIAVSSASIAVYTILRYKFKDGGARIAMPSYICRSVWDAVKMANCKPVLYDISSDTFSIEEEKIKPENTEMVIVAHMFGVKARAERLLQSGVEIIEDCAQRITPSYITNEPHCQWRVYSLEPTKLITCAQGGVIAGANKNNLKAIRNLLQAEYDFPYDSIKAPFTDLQACLAISQWKKLNHFLELRKIIAEYYIAELNKAGLTNIIHPSMLKDDTWHFRFVLNTQNPDYYISKMEDEGIICRKPVQPFGLHKLFNIPGNFANTDLATDTLLSIPIYPTLSHMEQEKVIHSLIKVHEQNTNK
jgi:dTDP-4-amino-4,6-dideoxygalactose transaminase